MLTTEDHFSAWLTAAKLRAAAMECKPPVAPAKSTPCRKLRRAKPSWYEQRHDVSAGDNRKRFIARRWSYRPRNGYKSGNKSNQFSEVLSCPE